MLKTKRYIKPYKHSNKLEKYIHKIIKNSFHQFNDNYPNYKIHFQNNDDKIFYKILLKYLNILFKLILPLKYKVFLSKELIEKLTKEKQHTNKKHLHVIMHRLTNKLSVSDYYSDRVFKPYSNDHSLSYGIHHLHLDPGKGSDLLYLVVNKDIIDSGDIVYLIDIGDHDKMYYTKLFDIISNNWPHICTYLGTESYPWHLSDPEWVYSPGDIKEARASGVNILINLSDGRTMFPLKNGITTSGDSAIVVSRAHRILKEIHTLSNKYDLDKMSECEFDNFELVRNIRASVKLFLNESKCLLDRKNITKK